MSGISNSNNAPRISNYATVGETKSNAAANFNPGATQLPSSGEGQYLPGNAQPRHGLKDFFTNHINGPLTAPLAMAAAPALATAGFLGGAVTGQAYQSKCNDKHPGIVAGLTKDVGKVGGDLSNIGGDVGKIFKDVTHFHLGAAIKDTFHLGGDSIKTMFHVAKTPLHVLKNLVSDVFHPGNTIKRASWNTGACLRTLGKSGVGSIMQNLNAGYSSSHKAGASPMPS